MHERQRRRLRLVLSALTLGEPGEDRDPPSRPAAAPDDRAHDVPARAAGHEEVAWPRPVGSSAAGSHGAELPAPAHGFVVAVSSVSGGGKTTLVKRAAALLGAAALFFDDYSDGSTVPPDLPQWLRDGAIADEWKTPRFAQDVGALRQGRSVTVRQLGAGADVDTLGRKSGDTVQPGQFVVIEEPMGRRRAEMAPHIDFVVVIDTPLEVALARRMLRDTASTPRGGVAAWLMGRRRDRRGLEYVRGFLEGYLEEGREVYQRVQDQAKASCDLILDGEADPSELARQLVEAVRAKAALLQSSGP